MFQADVAKDKSSNMRLLRSTVWMGCQDSRSDEECAGVVHWVMNGVNASLSLFKRLSFSEV